MKQTIFIKQKKNICFRKDNLGHISVDNRKSNEWLN